MIVFVTLIVLYLLLIVSQIVIAWNDSKSFWIISILYILPPIIILYFFITELSRFVSVGIYGVDKTIIKGINYQNSLKLCKNSLSFLGIGASKITQEEEFESTLVDCTGCSEIRFLLLKPTNKLLQEAAKRAGDDIQEYTNRVKKSLRKIRDIKNNRSLDNVKVRFYELDKPLFRLMFIDNSICLFSYNVFGKGDGSQLPQMHILRHSTGNIENTFYYPFQEYFEQLWNDSEEWDFNKYIEEK